MTYLCLLSGLSMGEQEATSDSSPARAQRTITLSGSSLLKNLLLMFRYHFVGLGSGCESDISPKEPGGGGFFPSLPPLKKGVLCVFIRVWVPETTHLRVLIPLGEWDRRAPP